VTQAYRAYTKMNISDAVLFKLKREEVESTHLPLTVRMFAESAEAGKWIYG